MPFSLEKEPTKEFIASLQGFYRDLWSDTHSKWAGTDTFTQNTFQVWDENTPDRPSYHPAQPSAIVDNGTDALMASVPHLHREPAGRGKAHKAKADHVEKWSGFALEKASLLEPITLWRTINTNFAAYGYAVIEGPMLNFDDKPEEPERKPKELNVEFERRQHFYRNDLQAWFPFRIRVPHPARVYLDPTEKQPRMALKVSTRYAYQLEELTAKKKRQQPKRNIEVYTSKTNEDNPFAKIKCLEFWSLHWHALVADDVLLFADHNTWGFVPFAHAFAGWGRELTNDDGVQTNSLAVGLLDHVKEPLRARAQAASARQNLLILAAFATRATTRDPAEVANALKQDIVQVQPGELWWLDTPQLQQWAFAEDATQAEDIEAATFSRGVAGHKVPGVSTVGQQHILSSLQNRKFGDPSKQREELASITISRLLRLVDVLDEKITVKGLAVGPDDLVHDYNMSVTFRDVDPVLQLNNRELGMQEVEAGLKSKDTYWSADAQLEDAEGERDRIIEDMVEESPEVLAIYARAAARRLGFEDMLDEVEAGGFGGAGAGGDSGVLGPDGQPLASTLGQGTDPNSRGGRRRARTEMRQPRRRPQTRVRAEA